MTIRVVIEANDLRTILNHMGTIAIEINNTIGHGKLIKTEKFNNGDEVTWKVYEKTFL